MKDANSGYGALMRTSLLCALSLAAALGFCSPALAQNQGFQLNRYEPTAAGEFSFAVDHPFYNSVRRFAAGLTLNYGHNPLVIGVRSADSSTFTTQNVILTHQLLGHIDLAVAIADRVLVSFSLPITLLERGDDAIANQFGVSLVKTAAVGDPRFGAMFRIYGDPYRSAFSLSLGGYFWIPTNTRAFPAQIGEKGFRVLPKLVLGGLSHHILWSVTAGYYYRPDASLGNLPAGPGNSVGAEVQLGGAIAYADLERRFSVGPEVILHTDAGDGHAFKVEHSNLEVLVGATYNIARLIQLGVAGGTGILRGPGTPDGRFLLRLSYAPMAKDKPKDRDHDCIADPEDACPDQAGVRTGSPSTNGCAPPSSDRDHDGVFDAQDLCPDEPAGNNVDPQKLGCPLRDTDGDGLVDSQNQCVSEPAGQRPDTQKPGCPLRDKDGDGVYDNEDLCIEISAGPHPSLSRKGCPDQDSDGDGVYDSYDQCPSIHFGLNPDPEKLGCALADRDHDQVPDVVDACPDRPGSHSPDPKKNGCPGLVEIRGSQIIIKEQVFFANNQDAVLNRSFPLLDAVAHTLHVVKQIKRLGIEGHTDNLGKPEHNIDLSDRRAQSVLKYLIAKGVEPARMEARGFGPSQPIADNKTPQGRALNRRVDFLIVDPPQVRPASAPTQTSTTIPAKPVPDAAHRAGKVGVKTATPQLPPAKKPLRTQKSSSGSAPATTTP